MALAYPWKLILGYKLDLTTLPEEVTPLRLWTANAESMKQNIASAYGATTPDMAGTYRKTLGSANFTKAQIGVATSPATSFSALQATISALQTALGVTYAPFGSNIACIRESLPTSITQILGLVDNTANPSTYPLGYQLRDIYAADNILVSDCGYGALVPYYFYMAQQLPGA